MIIHRSQVFPYNFLRPLFHENFTELRWSIGIYTGTSPFALTDNNQVKNPVLTAKSVTDINAREVADPFLIKKDSIYYMFFEVVNLANVQGDIGLAESYDGVNWNYKQIIIDEPFHLSYPYVFNWQGNYYLIPESNEDLSVRIYKATEFPFKWKYCQDLLTGYHFVDPSIVRYNDVWWLFVSSNSNDVLNLYSSDDLMGPWVQHPMSPIVKNDKNISRPGGRLLIDQGRLYRFAQDDDPTYGNQILAFEISEISKTSYKENIISNNPIVKASNIGWNAYGMHQVDHQNIAGGKWLVSVDGYGN